MRLGDPDQQFQMAAEVPGAPVQHGDVGEVNAVRPEARQRHLLERFLIARQHENGAGALHEERQERRFPGAGLAHYQRQHGAGDPR